MQPLTSLLIIPVFIGLGAALAGIGGFAAKEESAEIKKLLAAGLLLVIINLLIVTTIVWLTIKPAEVRYQEILLRDQTECEEMQRNSPEPVVCMHFDHVYPMCRSDFVFGGLQTAAIFNLPLGVLLYLLSERFDKKTKNRMRFWGLSFFISGVILFAISPLLNSLAWFVVRGTPSLENLLC